MDESILFKEHKLISYWNSPLLDNRLKFIIYALSAFTLDEFGKSVTITSIYRKGDKGVHGYWRGIDIRSHYYTNDEIGEIIKFLNKTVIYGNPSYTTALYHGVGQGVHIHIQVSWEAYTTLKKV